MSPFWVDSPSTASPLSATNLNAHTLDYATSLPGSPTDGLTIAWEVDNTNGVVWLMRWVTALSKWVFLGGGPLSTEILTSETTTSTTYADLATAGPSITLSVAGVYEIAYGSNIKGSTASNNSYWANVAIAGATAVDADGIFIVPNVANAYITCARVIIRTVATPFTLVMKYKVSAGTGTYEKRWMTVRPVTLS